MTRYFPCSKHAIVLRTTIIGAGVLAVLVLACAGTGTTAGATWVVDDCGGTEYT
jgi:hypothetical protein